MDRLQQQLAKIEKIIADKKEETKLAVVVVEKESSDGDKDVQQLADVVSNTKIWVLLQYCILVLVELVVEVIVIWSSLLQ